jgi:carbon monoxide dehydrogenase subunit G
MPTIDDSIDIDRSRDEVFAFIDDPANTVLTNSNVLEYEQEGDEPRGKGTRHRGMVKVAGRKIAFVDEVIEHRPPENVTLQSVEAPPRMSWTLEFRFEELGPDRTRLHFHQEVPSLGGFFGKLSDGLVTRMYSKDVRSNLDSTKVMLEEG